MKIYPKDDKRRLYWLIDLYLAEKIDDKTFCDELYYSYDLEIDKKTLNDAEKLVFEELTAITDRFSPFESDFIMAPGAFTNKEELRSAALKAKRVLDEGAKGTSYLDYLVCSTHNFQRAQSAIIKVKGVLDFKI